MDFLLTENVDKYNKLWISILTKVYIFLDFKHNSLSLISNIKFYLKLDKKTIIALIDFEQILCYTNIRHNALDNNKI